MRLDLTSSNVEVFLFRNSEGTGYVYVENDPVNRYDSTGLDSQDPSTTSDGPMISFDLPRPAPEVLGTGRLIYWSHFDSSEPIFGNLFLAHPVGLGQRGGGDPKPFGYNGAFNALAKKPCYEMFGFTSAAAAQSAFASLEFQVAARGPLQIRDVPGGQQQVVRRTPPPAQGGQSSIQLNSDYNWPDFSTVLALNVSTGSKETFDYLRLINTTMGTSMTTTQLSNLILLHEFRHTKPGGDAPQETDLAAFNSPIYDNCIK